MNLKVSFVTRGLLLLMILFMSNVGVAYGAEGEPPAAHAAISDYAGPETCGMCHAGVAQEVVESLHYQQQGEVPYREGWEAGKLGGMYVTY
jgi:hypothetical protein